MHAVRLAPTDDKAGLADSESVRSESLLTELTKNPDESKPVPFDEGDVGGELVAILSQGLYSDPLDSVREYVQNSVDANASRITIKFDANRITVWDDGDGMTPAELLRAKQFGMSSKSISKHVGFRGIGIYSGFDLCDRLTITSRKNDDSFVYRITFDFSRMRTTLDAERENVDGQRTPLLKLLRDNTTMRATPAGAGQSFTSVELQDVTDVHYQALSNRDQLDAYLKANLPVDFSDLFKHKAEINRQLNKHVPGYRAVRIVLQYPDEQEHLVAREMPDYLLRPQFVECRLPDDNTARAYVWSCLNEKARTIQERAIAGFTYKVKGFTIGDRDRLRHLFPRTVTYYWYTGEVYVLDDGVIPNAARNDFETNTNKRNLELALAPAFKSLGERAERQSNIQALRRYVLEGEDVATETKERLDNDILLDSFKAYSALNACREKIQRPFQRAELDENMRDERELKGKTEKVLQKLDRLLLQISREATKPNATATKKRKVARRGSPGRKGATRGSGARPPRTISQLFKDAGYVVAADTAAVLTTIDIAADDALMSGSEAHSRLLEAIEDHIEDDAGSIAEPQ